MQQEALLLLHTHFLFTNSVMDHIKQQVKQKQLLGKASGKLSASLSSRRGGHAERTGTVESLLTAKMQSQEESNNSTV